MRLLLFKNLKLTIPTILSFTVIGYLLSIPMSFLFEPEAAQWQFGSNRLPSISTQKLDNLRKFQLNIALGSGICGLVIAQTTFIISNLRESHSSSEL